MLMLHTLQSFIRCLNSLIFIQPNLAFLNLYLFIFLTIYYFCHLEQPETCFQTHRSPVGYSLTQRIKLGAFHLAAERQ